MGAGLAEVLVPDDDNDSYIAHQIVRLEVEANRDYVESGIDRLIAYSQPTNVTEVGGGPGLQPLHEKVQSWRGPVERRRIAFNTGRIIFTKGGTPPRLP